MIRFLRAWFKMTVVTKDRFRTGDKPSQLSFDRLFDSYACMLELADTATNIKQGLARLATDVEAYNRAQTNTDGQAMVVTPWQLPNIISSDSSVGITKSSESLTGGRTGTKYDFVSGISIEQLLAGALQPVTVTKVGNVYKIGWTGAASSATLPIGKTLFVDVTLGDDATALPYRMDLRYVTIQKAWENAAAGDTIFVFPGIYDEYVCLKDQVDYFFMPNTNVLAIGSFYWSLVPNLGTGIARPETDSTQLWSNIYGSVNVDYGSQEATGYANGIILTGGNIKTKIDADIIIGWNNGVVITNRTNFDAQVLIQCNELRSYLRTPFILKGSTSPLVTGLINMTLNASRIYSGGGATVANLYLGDSYVNYNLWTGYTYAQMLALGVDNTAQTNKGSLLMITSACYGKVTFKGDAVIPWEQDDEGRNAETLYAIFITSGSVRYFGNINITGLLGGINTFNNDPAATFSFEGKLVVAEYIACKFANTMKTVIKNSLIKKLNSADHENLTLYCNINNIRLELNNVTILKEADAASINNMVIFSGVSGLPMVISCNIICTDLTIPDTISAALPSTDVYFSNTYTNGTMNSNVVDVSVGGGIFENDTRLTTYQ
jgi:hypothetical protein